MATKKAKKEQSKFYIVFSKLPVAIQLGSYILKGGRQGQMGVTCFDEPRIRELEKDKFFQEWQAAGDFIIKEFACDIGKELAYYKTKAGIKEIYTEFGLQQVNDAIIDGRKFNTDQSGSFLKTPDTVEAFVGEVPAKEVLANEEEGVE